MRKLAVVCLSAVAALGALAGVPLLGVALAPETLLSDAPVLVTLLLSVGVVWALLATIAVGL